MDKTEDIDDTTSIDDLSETTDEFYNSLSETENIDDILDNDSEDADEIDERTEISSKCIYKYAENSDSDIEDSIEDIEELFDDDEQTTTNMYVPNEKRSTKPFLTKYERVRLLGVRAKQLAGGAKPLIKNAGDLSSKQIAELEIQNNVIPLIIDRPMPSGMIERWRIDELIH